jgi:hypothetical protein
MRTLRNWYHGEFGLIVIAFLLYLWLIKEERLFLAMMTLCAVLSLLLFGGIARKTIIHKAKKKSAQMGLRVVTLLKFHEDNNTICYEAHLLPNAKTTKKQIVKDCLQDVQVLANYRFDKEIHIYVTTHKVIREAWIRAWTPYDSAKHESIPNFDRAAGRSRLQWALQMKRFYGDINAAKRPKLLEWGTLKTVINRGGHIHATRANYSNKTT